MKSEGLNTYTEWSTNEKVALDNAFAAAVTGKRAACCMKQVGLNVAADSLMSAAYLGTVGGLVIISCDDPGPHSSQTEQDTRLMARLAKVPVLDPSTPQEAREMARHGLRPVRGVRRPCDPETGHTGLPCPPDHCAWKDPHREPKGLASRRTLPDGRQPRVSG